MANRVFVGVCLFLLAAPAWFAATAEADGVRATPVVSSNVQTTRAAEANPSSHRAVLDKYCVTCHNRRLKTAGVVLETADLQHPERDADVWERVIQKLRAGSMPPPGNARPDQAQVSALVAWLETELDRAAEAAPNPGRHAGIHRLNRAEYTNAVRDLLDIEIDGRSLLPGDDSGYGFDNIADALTVSPGLLDRYLLAAREISRIAVGDPTMRPAVVTYSLPYLTLLQNERMSEDLPFGSRGGIAVHHYFPLDGEYVVRIRAQRRTLNAGGEIRGLDMENHVDLRLDGRRVSLFSVGGGEHTDQPLTSTAEDRGDAGLMVHVPVKAGLRTVGVSFRQSTWYVEGVGMSRLPAASDAFAKATKTTRDYGRIDMGIDSVDIEGPFGPERPADTPSRRRIFSCAPAPGRDELCAAAIVSRLARRAYRRPTTPADIKTLMPFYRAGRTERGFEGGIEFALARILADPDFLLRIEQDPEKTTAGAQYRISDLELASRVSFFLWSSIPDDELLHVAATGQLHNPKVLARQVSRMLRDLRSTALVQNFFGQWLYTRNIAAHSPDLKAFPDFDENLRQAFQQETELFLGSQIREDRSATELLTADYTFLNERLARHYGVGGVYGSQFRRVHLPDDRRAGLLGEGGLLTVTSYANRTSPVVRGKWLLENVLGAPPPPPPPNVPPLKESGEGIAATSTRVRMEQHRANPVCASCHARMDPLGFALENFDGVGKWRSTEANTAIDASGTLPDGTPFDGPASFRQALLTHRDEFLLTLTKKMLTYALGRGIEPYDMPAVRRIIRQAAPGNYRWSALILEIAQSLPFQMTKAES